MNEEVSISQELHNYEAIPFYIGHHEHPREYEVTEEVFQHAEDLGVCYLSQSFCFLFRTFPANKQVHSTTISLIALPTRIIMHASQKQCYHICDTLLTCLLRLPFPPFPPLREEKQIFLLLQIPRACFIS